jgi:hypothetical protein
MLNKLILQTKSKLEEAKYRLEQSPDDLVYKKQVMYLANELVRLVRMKKLSSLNQKNGSQE